MVAFAEAELTEGLAAPLAFRTFLDRGAENTVPAEWVDRTHDQLAPGCVPGREPRLSQRWTTGWRYGLASSSSAQ